MEPEDASNLKCGPLSVLKIRLNFLYLPYKIYNAL